MTDEEVQVVWLYFAEWEPGESDLEGWEEETFLVTDWVLGGKKTVLVAPDGTWYDAAASQVRVCVCDACMPKAYAEFPEFKWSIAPQAGGVVVCKYCGVEYMPRAGISEVLKHRDGVA